MSRSSDAHAMEIELTLAGVPFRVTVDGAVNEAHVRARFGAFESAPGAAARPVELRLHVTPDWSPAHAPSVPYPGVEVTREGGVVRYLRAHDELTWEPSLRRAEGYALPGTVPLKPVEDPTALDTPLRLLLSYELLRGDGLLVHGCGYASERGAVVFLAVSGGGKTTTARKLPHECVLSDDQVALTRTPEGWFAHALPFVGEYARATRPTRSPLRAIVLLEKAPVASLRVVSGPTALARVTRCVVNFVPRDVRGARLLDRLADLTATVPTRALAIPRDEPVLPWIDDLLPS